MLEWAKIKTDEITEEETFVPLFLYESDVICLYSNRGSNFVVTKQGFMHKVPYDIEEMRDELGI